MKLEILGNTGSACESSYTSCALIDDNIAIDAGTGMHTLSRKRIMGIKNLLLTHSHFDHIAMLCFWVDIHITNGDNINIHCLPETAHTLRQHLFNNQIWPNMERIAVNGRQAMTINELTPFETVEIGNHRITPLLVEHGIPTLGYCLHGDNENFVFCFDMIDAPDAFWQYIADLKNFRNMAMEISFSNGNEELAYASKHLTPNMLKNLLDNKMPPDIHIHYNHVKAGFEQEISQQVAELFNGKVSALEQGSVFEI